MILMLIGENEKAIKDFLENINDEMENAGILDAHVVIEKPNKFVAMMKSGGKIEIDTWPSEKH